MSDGARSGDLSQLPVACSLYGQVHERCEFRTGSLYCIRPGCQNPHHREVPSDGSDHPRSL